MTLPSLSKIWQVSANVKVVAQIDLNTVQARIMRVIKNTLIGITSSPWTVSGSSNAGGTTGAPTGAGALDGVDRWTVDTDIFTNGSNSRHAWIVLRQDGIASHYEMCWDFTQTGNMNATTLIVSPSAGFTGGSATARPTATDEIIMINNTNWIGNLNTNYQIHIWQSTDGQCTRIIVWKNGGNLCSFFLFDKPQNPVSGWTNPSVTSAFINSGTGLIAPNYPNLSASPTSVGSSKAKANSVFDVRYTGESNTAGLLANTTDVGNLPNDFDGTWTFYPIGFYSVTSNNRGRHGNFFDLWWRPTAMNSGDTFPNNTSFRQFVAMGPFILPWTNDATVPLFA